MCLSQQKIIYPFKLLKCEKNQLFVSVHYNTVYSPASFHDFMKCYCGSLALCGNYLTIFFFSFFLFVYGKA